MELREARKGIVWTATAVIFVAAVSACASSRTYGPYTSSDIVVKLDQLKLPEPVYAPSHGSSLVSVFYYADLISDGWLLTYLGAKNPEGQLTRVAKFRTSVLGPALEGAMEGTRNVNVSWANNSTASTCTPKADLLAGDEFSGDPYQTCLVWSSEAYKFLLYSTLPLDDTLKLVNSLEKIRQGTLPAK